MAASFLGKLLVKIEGDNSDLDKSIKGSQGSVKKFSKFAVGAYALVGVAIIAVGKKFSKLAAQAEEIRSKFNVVFGRTAKEVKAWADTYSESVGRSTIDTLEFLGSIGDLLKPLGFQKDAVDDLSKVVVTLANDLGSFNDMPTADVMRDIQSAMVGNFEVTKKYGVVLNEAVIKQEAFNRGLFDGKGVVDAQVKAQIALDLIIKGTTDAQGDLIRTQDSTTNTMIRLQSATKDLGIELGTTINRGLTPMAGATATIIKNLTEWIKKNREVNDFLKEFSEGNQDASTEIDTLSASLEKLLARLDQANTRGSQNTTNLEEQISALKILIAQRARGATLELQFADAKAANDQAEIERITREKKANEEAIKDMEALTDAFADTKEGQIQALESAIAYFDTFIQGPMAVAVLVDLNEQLDKLNEGLEDEKLIIEDLDEWWTNFNQTVTGDLEGQSKAIKQLEIDWESLADNGLGAFASTFKQIGEEGVTVWDTLKQAGKNAISSVLEGLAQEALVRAALAFALPFGVGIPSGIAYTAAAAGAFAASGLVQNLAEGGVIQPATGGVPAVMAEAGVPEMAMPLTSSAINPFADAVANRISTTTNNNTQNFNSMFSLSDDNKLRETARKLFPFFEDERQRRGITV